VAGVPAAASAAETSSRVRRRACSFTKTTAITQTPAATTAVARNAGWIACASAVRSAAGRRWIAEPSAPRSIPRGSPWLTITPMMVTPSVAPICRPNCVSAVAEPITERGTAFCTESTNTCIIDPTPTPAISMFRAAWPFVVAEFIRQRSTIPIVRTTGPSTAFQR
jgi:hypothetical protein